MYQEIFNSAIYIYFIKNNNNKNVVRIKIKLHPVIHYQNNEIDFITNVYLITFKIPSVILT